MPFSFETAVRSAGYGVAGMYSQLFAYPTQVVAKGAAKASVMTQNLQQKAAQQPSAYNSLNAGASSVITGALGGVTQLGAGISKMFAGIAQAFAGGSRGG